MSPAVPPGSQRGPLQEKGIDKGSKDAWKAAGRHAQPGAAAGGLSASAYNPVSGTFHSLDSGASEQGHGPNGRYRSFDERNDTQPAAPEADSVSNNGSCSEESEDQQGAGKDKAGAKNGEGGAAAEKREKMRAKNEKKHQRQKERRALELRDKCTQFLTARKLEILAGQLIAMGFPKDRAIMALICNDGHIEQSVSWLLEGGESKTKEDWNALGALKLDISEELARLAEMEIRYGYARAEVERAVVQAEGDLEKAATLLRERFPQGVGTPPDKSPSPSPAPSPSVAGSGPSPGTSPGVFPRLAELGIHQQTHSSGFPGIIPARQPASHHPGARTNGTSGHERDTLQAAQQHARWQAPPVPGPLGGTQRYAAPPAEAPAAGSRASYQQQNGNADVQRPNSADGRNPTYVGPSAGPPSYRLPPGVPQPIMQPGRYGGDPRTLQASAQLQQQQQQRYSLAGSIPIPPRSQTAGGPGSQIQRPVHHPSQPSPPHHGHGHILSQASGTSLGVSNLPGGGWSNGTSNGPLSCRPPLVNGQMVGDQLWNQPSPVPMPPAPLDRSVVTTKGMSVGRAIEQPILQAQLQQLPNRGNQQQQQQPLVQSQQLEHVHQLTTRAPVLQQKAPAYPRNACMPGSITTGWSGPQESGEGLPTLQPMVDEAQPIFRAPMMQTEATSSIPSLSTTAGLLAGWGSGLTGSQVDWSMGAVPVSANLHNVDWSVSNGPATSLWGLTGGISSLGLSSPSVGTSLNGAPDKFSLSAHGNITAGTSTAREYELWTNPNGVVSDSWQAPSRSTRPIGTEPPAPGPAGGSQEWTNPFAGKDLFQHQTVPSETQ